MATTRSLMITEREFFTCEHCGYELPMSELCCGSCDEYGQVVTGYCKACDTEAN